MKHLKKYYESLAESSKNDLESFKIDLEFINRYDIETHEAIDIIDKLLKMEWSEIEEWREHITTNYSKDDKDEFTVELIDRYCSDIEDGD